MTELAVQAVEDAARRKAVHNEQVNLRATGLNTVGVGFVVAGVITPLTLAGIGTVTVNGQVLAITGDYGHLVRSRLRVTYGIRSRVGGNPMITPVVLTMIVVPVVTVVLVFGGVLASRRSARALDNAEREKIVGPFAAR